jgi:hypothetical protein
MTSFGQQRVRYEPAATQLPIRDLVVDSRIRLAQLAGRGGPRPLELNAKRTRPRRYTGEDCDGDEQCG